MVNTPNVPVITTGSHPLIAAPSPTTTDHISTTGSHPVVTAPSQISGSGSHPAIISGVPNPQAHIANDILNSLKGTGSLATSNVHVGSIQQNLARAISVSNEFSDKPAQVALVNAQKAMAEAAGAKDAAARNAAFANAKQALIQANNEMASRGYGKPIISTASVNNNKLFGGSGKQIIL